MKKLLHCIGFLLLFMNTNITTISAQNTYEPQYSTAGFYQLPNTGREAYSMNPAWRFFKGNIAGAEAIDFDDQSWSIVSLPHGIEYIPAEASGGINYQGVTWYRKHFAPTNEMKNKKLFLHFEGIMGKSDIYINGKLAKTQYGGYLPAIVDVTDLVKWDNDNVIAVCTDNSDNPSYPPGKAQDVLDFCYFGGIYRDCWLIAHNNLYITDPNYVYHVAGGGLFVAYDNVSQTSADILLQTQVMNDTDKKFSGYVQYDLLNTNGIKVASSKNNIQVSKGKTLTSKNKIILQQPQLWSPESPTLYNLVVKICDNKGNIIDGYRRRIGIRSIEFKGEKGFWLNGKPYDGPIMGANRHQDFALVGNAVPNNTHWRDAKKLRDAGLKVIRNAHYPQDPAFMDACDELGLFVIVNTPGWQFWNDEPQFAEFVYSDIKNMIRRDRNHPSVWMWEPILNETWYPEDFAKNTRDIVDREYPYNYCYSGCDSEAKGHEHFQILFCHPMTGDSEWAAKNIDPKITYFTREWGDNVDNWNSHNSPSRVARNWGEQPMLIQAKHYAKPYYKYTCYNSFYETSPQHIGGCLWHSFDHQRGYHPDPFYGGIMDAYRQPKYAYQMFKAQRSTQQDNQLFETGPMVFIAHEMTPFSDKNVMVFSNCDEVRLTFNKEGNTKTHKRVNSPSSMPSPIMVFENVYDFMLDKKLTRSKKQEDVYLLAEGFIDGKCVATHKVYPARRPEKIVLWTDHENVTLKADGSDFIPVVAGIADKDGNIKRLNNYHIKFQIEGEGNIIGGAETCSNPQTVQWGTAPALIQSTLNPGKIWVTASVLFEGSQMPVSATIEIISEKPQIPLIYNHDENEKLIETHKEQKRNHTTKTTNDLMKELNQKKINNEKLKEVEKQQTDFGEQR